MSTMLPNVDSFKRFTIKEWSAKSGIPESKIQYFLNRRDIKRSEVFKLAKIDWEKKQIYKVPHKSEIGKYRRREWARKQCYKVFNFLSWLDHRPELKKLFKEPPKVVYALPKGRQIKTMTAGRWAKAKGYNEACLVNWMKVRGLKNGKYFIDGLTASTKVILPKGNDLKRFTVPEWTKKLNVHKKSVYSYLRVSGLNVEDYFKPMRGRFRLPDGFEIKKYFIGQWAIKIGVSHNAVIYHLKKDGVEVGEYFKVKSKKK